MTVRRRCRKDGYGGLQPSETAASGRKGPSIESKSTQSINQNSVPGRKVPRWSRPRTMSIEGGGKNQTPKQFPRTTRWALNAQQLSSQLKHCKERHIGTLHRGEEEGGPFFGTFRIVGNGLLPTYQSFPCLANKGSSDIDPFVWLDDDRSPMTFDWSTAGAAGEDALSITDRQFRLCPCHPVSTTSTPTVANAREIGTS